MYGITRKDANNRTQLGITSYAVICVGAFAVIFYFSSKAIKEVAPVATDKAAIASVDKTRQSLNRWDKIQVDSALGEVAASKRRTVTLEGKPDTPKPDQGVLEMQAVSLTELKTSDMMEYRPQLGEQATGLEALVTQTRFGEQLPQGAKVERSDDGKAYLRTRSGVFTGAAEPGLRLVGPSKETYVIGDDTLIYSEGAEGKRTKLETKPTELLHDLKFRYYKIDPTTKELQLATPGGPGAFRGPDGLNYAVSTAGTIQRMEGSKLADTRLLGLGEFVGTDGQTYVLANNVLFSKTTTEVSFGQKNISGVGHFRDPSGELLLRAEDGNLYAYDENKNPKRANLRGVGTFTGPDGTLYRRDENSNIVRLVATAAPQALQPPSGVVAPVAKGLSGASKFSATVANYTNGKEIPADKAASDLKGGIVYAAAEAPATPPPALDNGSKDFLPIGRRIPFYTLTKVSTQFDSPGVIEASVAENVYFHDAVLPAGVRLYGNIRASGRNSRIEIVFTTMVFPDGRELTVSGQVFDPSLLFGIEAYLKPLPAWVKLMRYSQVPVLTNLAKNAAANAGGTGATLNVGGNSASPAQEYAVNLIRRTQEEFEQENAAYLVLPPGTAGVLILTNRLVLKPTNSASAAPAPQAAPSLREQVGPALSAMGQAIGNGVSAAATQSVTAAREAIQMVEPARDVAGPMPKGVNDAAGVDVLFGKSSKP